MGHDIGPLYLQIRRQFALLNTERLTYHLKAADLLRMGQAVVHFRDLIIQVRNFMFQPQKRAAVGPVLTDEYRLRNARDIFEPLFYLGDADIFSIS